MQRAFSLSIRVVFLLLLLLFGAMGIALAQQTINYASAGGRVTDPAGAVVPGAQVTARQTETNLSRTTTTDQEEALSISLPQARAVRGYGKSGGF